MDILIKKNIVKQNKIIVDIGTFALKLLNVHYASKKVEITDAKVVNAINLFPEGKPDISEIAKKVDENAIGKGRRNMTVILPQSVCECKIISVKNKKITDIPKIIEKEHAGFSKVSNITHVIDYAYLGKREEQGDTVHYCMLSAVSKTFANDLVTEFAAYKMKVTTMIPVEYAQVCLSELFFDDYEDLNRLFIDFGTRSTRVTAFSEGVPVYTRTIEYGISTYCDRLFQELSVSGKVEIRSVLSKVGSDRSRNDNEQFLYIDQDIYYDCVDNVSNEIIAEIRRVSDMCANNDVLLTKIYCTGFMVPGFGMMLGRKSRLKTERISFRYRDEKEGKGYLTVVDTDRISTEHANAFGAAMYPVM